MNRITAPNPSGAGLRRSLDVIRETGRNAVVNNVCISATNVARGKVQPPSSISAKFPRRGSFRSKHQIPPRGVPAGTNKNQFPNSKIQIPMKFQLLKIQIPNRDDRRVAFFGHWYLKSWTLIGYLYLVFGIL
jgi:hypothetical protein